LSRALSFLVLLVMLAFLSAAVGVPAAAGSESDDAKVAFGAFADGLYDFAGSELEQFLAHYPKSKMAPRARLVLVLCSLKTSSCLKAAQEFDLIEKPFKVTDFKVDPATLLLRIGECFRHAGEPQKASIFFTRAIKEYGKSDAALRARFALALILFAEHKYAAVVQQVTPLLAADNSKRVQALKIDRREIYWLAGLSHFQIKHFATALPLLVQIRAKAAEFLLTSVELQDLNALIIESAWHLKRSSVMLRSIKHWLQIPKAEIDSARLVSATLLTADRLRAEKRLPEIREILIRVAGFSINKADKIALYDLLVAIDSEDGRQKSLKGWFEALISLHAPGTSARIVCLESLLLLDYQLQDYKGVVASGRKLLSEKAEFWQDEKFYFPFIVALGRLNECREIVKYVPAKLPIYNTKTTGSSARRRLVLDELAGSCLTKLGRVDAAVSFYHTLYAHYKAPAVRVKILVALHALAQNTKRPEDLDEWVGREVMNHFSLDRREDEKLLKESPELVMLVAEHLFRSQEYVKALPALLWLEKLDFTGRLGERVKFLLAESYYRCDELAEARVRFVKLYAGKSKDFRYLAALRLVTIYEGPGRSSEIQVGAGRLEKLYRDLIAWESDPAVKRELKRKLGDLKGLKIDTTATK